MRYLKSILNFFENNRKTSVLLLIVVNLLILSANFTHKPTAELIGPNTTPGYVPDVKEYVLFTLYFRGENDGKELENPYTYRPLTPLLAAQLKFLEPADALNIINILVTFLSIYYLFKLQIYFKLNFSYSILGCYLFVFSFPNFYYTTTCRIDPMLILLVTIGIYLIFNSNNLILFLIYILGAAAKESFVIIPLFHFCYLFFNKTLNIKNIAFLIFNFILFLITSFLIRKNFNFGSFYLWKPRWKTVNENIFRPKSYISFLLTYSLFGYFNLIYIKYFSKISNQEKSLYVGVLLSVLLYLYTFFGAYTDGRPIWLAYPFAIPLVTIYLKKRIENLELIG